MAKDDMIWPGENDAPRFSDERTEKRKHEILSNENDAVTEEDISNIRTDVHNIEGVEEGEEIIIPDEELLDHKEDDPEPEDEIIKDDSDPETGNSSWNVLGS